MIEIVAFDPGLANMGWARMVVAQYGFDIASVECGVISTKPSGNLSSAENHLARVNIVRDAVDRLLATRDVNAVSLEAMSYPRSAKAAMMLGSAVAVIGCCARSAHIPVALVTSREVKRAVCGWPASKAEVTAEIKRRFPSVADTLDIVPKRLHEHACDAVGVALAYARKHYANQAPTP